MQPQSSLVDWVQRKANNQCSMHLSADEAPPLADLAKLRPAASMHSFVFPAVHATDEEMPIVNNHVKTCPGEEAAV